MNSGLSALFRCVPAALIAVIVVAQGMAAVHAVKHESGSPLDSFCATCVLASQLAGGCVDSCSPIPLSPVVQLFSSDNIHQAISAPGISPHQRGPPRQS